MKLESINIDFAENGFKVSCSYREEKKKGKETEMMGYMEPKVHVFKTADEVSKFVNKKLGTGPKDLGDEKPGAYRRRRDKGEGDEK